MIMKKKLVFVNVVLLMLLLSAAAVMADVVYINENFDTLDSAIWNTSGTVTQSNGEVSITGSWPPGAVFLRNGIDFNNKNIVAVMNITYVISNGAGFQWAFCRTPYLYPSYKTCYAGVSGYNGYGVFKNLSEHWISGWLNILNGDGAIVRWKFNSTHQCLKLNNNDTVCTEGINKTSTILHNGMLQVVSGTLNITAVKICEDTDDDMECAGDISSQELSVEWDGESPANETITNDDPVIFDFIVNGSNSSVRCDLYSNDTGAFTIEDYETPLGNGSFDLEYDTGAAQEDYLVFFINCFDGSQSVNTSFKHITIDKVNVLIDIISPAATTYYSNFTDNIFANVSFDNELLDFVYFNVTYSNGTLLYYNSSTPGVAEFSFLENVTLAALDTYTLNAWGNDSASNVASDSVSFTYAVYMVSPPAAPAEPSRFTFLSLVPLVVMIFALYWFWGMFFKK